MDFLLIALLTVLNGLFAMSEMAVSTSRKARLTALAEAGDQGAAMALKLQDEPTRFLSTVQVGITSTGILNGIVGEAAFSAGVAQRLVQSGLSERVAAVAATALVVTIITFVTIVFGELVPKRVGQMYPETVARWVAGPMNGLARLAGPFVRMLSVTTQLILRWCHLDRAQTPSVTQEELHASLAEGLDAGLIEAHEHQMVRNVFHLDDRPLTSLMTPREDIVHFDAQDSVHDCLRQLSLIAAHEIDAAQATHSWYPVCKTQLDDVVGVISISRLLALVHGAEDSMRQELLQQPLQGLCEPATFVPETLSGLELLEQFKRHVTRLALVVDEYGSVQGLVSPRDLLEGITGELKAPNEGQSWAIHHPDGTWSLDGLMPVSELKTRLGYKSLPDEDKDRYNTLGGLLMSVSGHLPEQHETMELGQWVFCIERLQGRRIDRVLARSSKHQVTTG